MPHLIEESSRLTIGQQGEGFAQVEPLLNRLLGKPHVLRQVPSVHARIVKTFTDILDGANVGNAAGLLPYALKFCSLLPNTGDKVDGAVALALQVGRLPAEAQSEHLRGCGLALQDRATVHCIHRLVPALAELHPTALAASCQQFLGMGKMLPRNHKEQLCRQVWAILLANDDDPSGNEPIRFGCMPSPDDRVRLFLAMLDSSMVSWETRSYAQTFGPDLVGHLPLEVQDRCAGLLESVEGRNVPEGGFARLADTFHLARAD
jgi:hypothetical protein